MSTMKACLFGGTLWAAGATALASTTWGVDPVPGFVPVSIFVHAIDSTTGDAYENFNYGGYPLNLSGDAIGFASAGFDIGPLAAYAGVNATEIGGFATRRNNVVADVQSYAAIGAFLSVATDTQVLIEMETGNSQSVFTRIADWTGATDPSQAVQVFAENRTPGDGPLTQVFTLEGGRRYQISGWANMTTGTGTASWSVTIVPAPSAAGVLALGGLLAARRRR